MIPESIIKRLVAGDNTAVDEVIVAHIPLANKIARYFARRAPRKAEDIKSVALLGLCRAVHKIKNGVMKTDNIKTYINNTIRGHIKHYIQQDHVVHIPNWYLAKHMDEEGFAIPIAYAIDRRDDDEENPEEGDELTYDVVAPERGDAEIIREFYETLSNFEKTILKLRSEGYTLMEIGEQVGKSHVWVHETLNRIQDKVIKEKQRHGR